MKKNMNLLVAFLGLFCLTLFVSQSVKLLFRRQWLRPYFFQEFIWVFIYGSGPPSSHTAVLTASLVFIGDQAGYSSLIFITMLVSSILWIYEMYMQRSRFYVISKLLSSENNRQKNFFKQWSQYEDKNPLKKLGRLLENFSVENERYRQRLLFEWKDLAGHDFIDLIWGLLVGLVISTWYLEVVLPFF